MIFNVHSISDFRFAVFISSFPFLLMKTKVGFEGRINVGSPLIPSGLNVILTVNVPIVNSNSFPPFVSEAAKQFIRVVAK